MRALGPSYVELMGVPVLVGGTQETLAHFLLGVKDDHGEQKQSKVGLRKFHKKCYPHRVHPGSTEHAFDSPTTHGDAVQFLRKYCKDLNAHGGCIGMHWFALVL